MSQKLYKTINNASQDCTMTIDYYITTSNISSQNLYGIKVVCTQGNEMYQESIKNISSDSDIIYRILDIISNNLVTPTTLIYIIDDLYTMYT